MVGRLDAVNGTADEIDQRVRPIELARPRAEGSRVPNDEPARSVAGWLMSPQHDDLGSAANQVSGEALAQKSCAASNYHSMSCRHSRLYCRFSRRRDRPRGDGVQAIMRDGILNLLIFVTGILWAVLIVTWSESMFQRPHQVAWRFALPSFGVALLIGWFLLAMFRAGKAQSTRT